ncbi:Uncharacterised protein [Mycobacteroides abscessus subsp. abscessus]|nr:Uncharacterised protein [Mycobacteroides abscessus subsp. abscessus]
MTSAETSTPCPVTTDEMQAVSTKKNGPGGPSRMALTVNTVADAHATRATTTVSATAVFGWGPAKWPRSPNSVAAAISTAAASTIARHRTRYGRFSP